MPAGRADALGGAFDLALAKAVPAVPERPGLSYEAKYDGWRCAGVVEGGRVRVWSRNGTDLTPRLPEITAALAEQVPDGCVLDGESVMWRNGRLDFDGLSLRLGAGPALARRLAAEHPASLVVFDVLAVLGRDVRALPLRDRRALLEQLAEGFRAPLQLSPATTDPEVAHRWWDDLAETGIEGLIAKPLDAPYRGGERQWLKAKRREPADAVCAAVTGSRAHPAVLILGLPDRDGRLRIAGRTAPLGRLQSNRAGEFLRRPVGEHPWPDEVPSTWVDRFDRDRRMLHLTLVAPVVVEVSADSARVQGAFRHKVRLLRFRPDIDPWSVGPD